MIEKLNNQINRKEGAMITKAIQPSFGWDTAIGYLQHCADNQVGEPIDIMQYKLPVAEQIDSIRPVFEYLNENLDKEVIGADLYVTLTTVGASKYKSKNDSLLWNVIGTSNLNVQEEERTVEQGDLIYIPAETEYTFKPNEARAYVLFSI